VTRREATGGPDPELVALAGRLLDTIDEIADEIASSIEARVEFYATRQKLNVERVNKSTTIMPSRATSRTKSMGRCSFCNVISRQHHTVEHKPRPRLRSDPQDTS
jgi:hypothetical protein